MSNQQITDKYGTNYLQIESDGSINANSTVSISSVPIKDGASATLATVKTDGVNNGLVVIQNSVPTTTVTASNLDIRDLTSVSDSVEVKQATGTNLHSVIDSGTITTVTNAVTVQQSTASSLKVDLSGTATNTNALKVDGSAVTQPVSGTFWQTTQPVSATDLDIRNIDWATDDIKSYAADECQRILTSDDAVTTVNYATSAKASVSNIVTSSAGLGRKVTDTYDNSGATTLVITRAVANV